MNPISPKKTPKVKTPNSKVPSNVMSEKVDQINKSKANLEVDTTQQMLRSRLYKNSISSINGNNSFIIFIIDDFEESKDVKDAPPIIPNMFRHSEQNYDKMLIINDGEAAQTKRIQISKMRKTLKQAVQESTFEKILEIRR